MAAAGDKPAVRDRSVLAGRRFLVVDDHAYMIDVIAEVARSNKRMIYYYFESKEQLYIAALEHAYIDMRVQEAALALGELAPPAAIRTLQPS